MNRQLVPRPYRPQRAYEFVQLGRVGVMDEQLFELVAHENHAALRGSHRANLADEFRERLVNVSSKLVATAVLIGLAGEGAGQPRLDLGEDLIQIADVA